MRESTFKIASGKTEEYQLDGQYIRNDDAMPTISVTVYSADHFEEKATIRAGDAVLFDNPFVRVQIAHGEASDQTIKISYGHGEISAARVSGSVAITNGASMTNSNKTVTNASGQVLAANSARRFLMIQNKDAAGIIYVTVDGSAATTANGLKIGPDGVLILDAIVPTGQINAIGSIASNANIVVVEG